MSLFNNDLVKSLFLFLEFGIIMKLITIVLSVFFLCLTTSAGDSVKLLKSHLDNNISDMERADLLIELSDKLTFTDPMQGFDYARQAMNLAHLLNNDELILRSMISVGKNALYAGLFDTAFVYFHRVEKIEVKPENMNLRINNLIMLGTLHNQRHAYDSAHYYYMQSLDLAMINEDPKVLAAIYNNMGTLADSKGDLQKAFDHYLKSLKYYEEIGDIQNQAITLNNIGLLNQNLGDLQRAIDYTKRAAAINEQLKSYYHLSTNYGNLGGAYQEMKNFVEAEKYLMKSYKIAGEQGFVIDEARALLNLGVMYLNFENLDKAKEAFDRSLKICIENDIVYGLLLNYFNLVDIFTIENMLDSAEYYLDKTYKLAIELDQLPMIKKVYSQKSELYEKTGRFAEALQYHLKYDVLRDSLQKMANKEHIQEMQTKYETEKKEIENQYLRAENRSNARIIRMQKLAVAAAIVILILLALLSWVIYRSGAKIKLANKNLNKLNNKILQQNKALEDMNLTKDKLFSVVAHDLRSPFNSLLGFLQMYLDDFDSFEDEEKKDMLNMLYHQANDTYSLLENLLQWSMAQRGQISFKPGIHDLHQLAETEIRFLTNRANMKKIGIKNEIPPETFAWVDENLVRIIFRNVINNSIKFTHHNGEIRLVSAIGNDHINIKIKDTGVGMSPEKLNDLFKPKENSSSKGTAQEQGSGLGLLLVKEFAEINQATFFLESKEGQGTTFSINFKQTGPV